MLYSIFLYYLITLYHLQTVPQVVNIVKNKQKH